MTREVHQAHEIIELPHDPDSFFRHPFSEMYDALEGRDRGPVNVEIIPTDEYPPPMFYNRTYLAQVGPERVLELRFVEIPEPVLHIDPSFDLASLAAEGANIALLMTDERHNDTIRGLGDLMYDKLRDRGIGFSSVVSPVSLGTVLARAIARRAEAEEGWPVIPFSLQKGKFLKLPEGDTQRGGFVHIPPDLALDDPTAVQHYLQSAARYAMGPPKPWVYPDDCLAVSSGTSREGSTQLLALDDEVARYMKWRADVTGLGVVWVDDAYLLGGTAAASLGLLEDKGIPVSAVITVLNEGPNDHEIDFAGKRIPRLWLTKLPLFAHVYNPDGRVARIPIPGTYDGLVHFLRRV